MRAVKSVSIDSEKRVIITFLDGSTETLYPNCIWCDSEALRQLIKDLLEEKADAIVQTINNVTVATFEDGADEALIKKLLVSIEPIQEGTGDPSPENVRPISGRTGVSVIRCEKNLLPNNAFKSTTKQGLTYIVNPDGTVSVSGTATASSYIYCEATFPESIIINGVPESNGVAVVGTSIQVYSTTPNVGGSITQNNTSMVIPANEPVSIRLRINNGVTVDNALFKPMARISADTDYSFEPYKGTEVSVNWETEAGTVYGGTLNVVSGVLTVTHGIKLVKYSEGQALTIDGVFLFRTKINDIKDDSLSRSFICSHFFKPSGYIAQTPSQNGMITNQYFNTYNVCMRNDALTTAGEWETWLKAEEANGTPVQLVYELATPTEIQLTPQEITTLLGSNSIWADSGNILELEYVADTKLYIGESQSGTLGGGRQSISNTDLQPVSEKTVEDLTEAVKDETVEKETQEETERG